MEASVPVQRSADQAAEQVLREVWMADGLYFDGTPIPVDPITIGRRMGLKVFTADLESDVSGLLIKRLGQDPEIHLQDRDSRNRRRFTCAHELGHYVRRVNLGDDDWAYIDHRDFLSAQGSDPDEIFANQFAASLLMPEKETREAFARWGKDVAVLAYTFGVSEDAMTYRLKNLRLI